MSERKFRLDHGDTVKADGNLQTLLVGLYDTISLHNRMVYSTAQLADTIKKVVAQMDREEQAGYLVQSLIVTFKFYERELIKEKLQQHQQDARGEDREPDVTA